MRQYVKAHYTRANQRYISTVLLLLFLLVYYLLLFLLLAQSFRNLTFPLTFLLQYFPPYCFSFILRFRSPLKGVPLFLHFLCSEFKGVAMASFFRRLYSPLNRCLFVVLWSILSVVSPPIPFPFALHSSRRKKEAHLAYLSQKIK